MTILDKDLSRESTVKYNGREIQVTLTADQTISFKLKGMKSGTVSISIEDIYRQLMDDEDVSFSGITKDAIIVEEVISDNKVDKSWLDAHSKHNPMISLNVLRTKMNTSPLSMDKKTALDSFIVDCIQELKKPILDKEVADKAAKQKKRT